MTNKDKLTESQKAWQDGFKACAAIQGEILKGVLKLNGKDTDILDRATEKGLQSADSQINNILVELREQVESLIDINNGVIGEQTIGAISALKEVTQLINSIMERYNAN